MLLSWRIRYFDANDRQFKDRDLWLITEELDAVTKAAVEACHELQNRGGGRQFLRYRALFHERTYAAEEVQELLTKYGSMSSFCLDDYHEDENGVPLTSQQLAVALTGSDTAVMLPSGAKQHDIDYILADKPPIDFAQITLSPEQLRISGYFTRDLLEMISTAFYKEGPGTLSGTAGKPLAVQTAVTEEEIRSFLMIFRRLYMKDEPANLQKASAVVAAALSNHPFGAWIRDGAAAYASNLDGIPDAPFAGTLRPTFSRKRLIDVFLYTQYAHQPDPGRQRQFHECLQAVRNQRPLLTYLFLTELWRCGIEVRNVGMSIARLFDVYCQHHQIASDVILSASSAHSGIGTLEKKQEREDRILQKKASELATSM